MKQVAPDLWMLSGFPPNAINVYLMGDVLVDAGTRHSGRRIFRQLEGRKLAAHALTHAHPDHQGASKAVCERLGVELWCGERDADAMESGNLGQKRHPLNTLIMKAVGRARRTRSPAACARATRSPASACWTCPVTRPDMSPTGASPTAC